MEIQTGEILPSAPKHTQTDHMLLFYNLKENIQGLNVAMSVKYTMSVSDTDLRLLSNYLNVLDKRYRSDKIKPLNEKQVILKKGLNLTKVYGVLERSPKLKAELKTMLQNHCQLLQHMHFLIFKRMTIHDFIVRQVANQIHEFDQFKELYHRDDIKLFSMVVQIFMFTVEIIAVNFIESILPIHYPILKPVEIIYPDQLVNINEQYVCLEPTLFKQFSNYCYIDNTEFQLPYLSAKYPETKVEAISQYRYSSKLEQINNQTSFQIPISHLNIYHQIHDSSQINSHEHFLKLDHSNTKLIAPNVSLRLFPDIEKKLKYSVSKWFLPASCYDLLGYLSCQIQSVTIPNLEFKVEDTWIGATYCILDLVHYNFGPASIQWYVCCTADARNLLSIVKKQLHIDILDSPGIWFADIEWCIKNNFKITKIIQDQGQVVGLPTGCIFWNISKGNSTSQSWYNLRKNVASLTRFEQSSKLTTKKDIKTLIPLKNLLLQFGNTEYLKLPTQTLRHLIQIYQQAMNLERTNIQIYLKQTSNKKIELLEISDHDSFCANCSEEFFVYFLVKEESKFCVRCGINEKKQTFNIKIRREEISIYFLVEMINIQLNTSICMVSKGQSMLLRNKYFVGEQYRIMNQVQQTSCKSTPKVYRYIDDCLKAQDKFFKIVKESTQKSDPFLQNELEKLSKLIDRSKVPSLIGRIKPYFGGTNLSKKAWNILDE